MPGHLSMELLLDMAGFEMKHAPAIVRRFQQAFADALNAPDVVERLKATDQIVLATSPAEAARVLAADSIKWGAVARKIKLGLD